MAQSDARLHFPAPIEPDPHWRREAACAGAPVEVFFPDSPNSPLIATAKAICAHCPIQDVCLRYALVNNVEDGIWGGMTEGERQIRRQRRNRRTVA